MDGNGNIGGEQPIGDELEAVVEQVISKRAREARAGRPPSVEPLDAVTQRHLNSIRLGFLRQTDRDAAAACRFVDELRVQIERMLMRAKAGETSVMPRLKASVDAACSINDRALDLVSASPQEEATARVALREEVGKAKRIVVNPVVSLVARRSRALPRSRTRRARVSRSRTRCRAGRRRRASRAGP